MKKFFKNSFFLPIAVVVIIVIVITALTVRNMNNSNSQVLGDDQRFELPKATASQTLNKVYNFPLRDASGKEVSKLRYEITGAETRNEIIVKGQRNRAVQGRTFMILNIKITNTFDKAVSINSRDYIRLTVNDNSEKLAPTIHNDPVEVDPISTKYTRLGFALNDNDKNLTLQVGEVKGSKETLKLNLK